MKERCLVIPAIKKNAVIPDQLVKRLAGKTLISRAIDTARGVCLPEDIIVLTDSQEITLFCERAGVRFHRNKDLRFTSRDIVREMQDFLGRLAAEYVHCIIYRASCPLITWVDIENAWKEYRHNGADALVTVRKVHHRLWNMRDGNLERFLEKKEHPFVVENRALIMLKLALLPDWDKQHIRILPCFLNEQGIEIQGYQDWWICERLLQRRHIVFVVAGFPAIGMGHVFRALMMAHEIVNHKITFVCTRESELAVENIAERDYPIVRQGDEPLEETVLHLRPDLVINDFLNTPLTYMQALSSAGIRAINFEDDGEGASLAALVINALYEAGASTERVRTGPSYFCLRDEFLEAKRNELRDGVRTLLITFGGTDQYDCTHRVLAIVAPICRAYGIRVRIVVGPGYAHKESLAAFVKELENPLIECTWATNIMSRMMEGADLAISSAGRTVYELAHMRIPALVLAHHEREARHSFARPKNGFAFVGIMQKVSDTRIRNMFLAMLKQTRRARFWQRQNNLDFVPNKARVIALMERVLEADEV
ncbi:MAG: cytidine 5'-phosphate N-acetylneuraminic acid synthetase [Desulfovibrio sp.]|nr:cytidine 5'-phosphate N-acetylneuraminic acid synthetase [Desulfovibrio sp.]